MKVIYLLTASCLYVKELSNKLSSQQLTSDDVPIVIDKLINFVANNGMITKIMNYKLYLCCLYSHRKFMVPWTAFLVSTLFRTDHT